MLATHKFSIAVCTALWLGGCALAGNSVVQDIGLESAQVLDPARPADAARMQTNLHGKMMLDVVLSANEDLRALAGREEYHIGAEASLCDKGQIDPARALELDPYVYDDTGKIDFGGRGAASPAGKYHVYVSLSFTQIRPGSGFEYDLQGEPADFCILLRGGNMTDGAFRSNVVVIPKAVIEKAVEGL